jgi:hypothetical protein
MMELEPRALARPIQRLRAERIIRTTGQRRGTRYFARR